MYADTHLSVCKYEDLRTHNEIIFRSKLYTQKEIEKNKGSIFTKRTRSKLGTKVYLVLLLIETTKSIFKTLDKYELSRISGEKLELIGKWGMDGASS